MFDSLLIANRGEIARRIARTARRLGIRVIAVYSEADKDMPFVKEADEAHEIGPAPVAESYLQRAKILEVAKRTGAQAIHPGYGLLAENTGFAREAMEAGITWVGPAPEAIDAMGLKDRARALMKEAGVPIVPGSEPIADPAEAVRVAESIGFPVMVKAAAGGGGIGMQKVKKPEKLEKGIATAQRRAESAFGNPAVYIEKYLDQPRHIEVQILGLNDGTVLHLYERECSIQRRHQKIIEETPTPAFADHPEKRDALCAAAVKAAEAIGYRNAGTVEFMVDANLDFYFLEMNTRLQVEHPITEMCCGVDLVEAQLKIAAGEDPGLAQAAIRPEGHAIEVRLYAENPEKKFLPAPGAIDEFNVPMGEHIRLDSGFEPGLAVTPYYDPLIAKLCVWAESRDAALDRMRDTLNATRLGPITHNGAFCAKIMDDEAFRAGEIDTHFIETRMGIKT